MQLDIPRDLETWVLVTFTLEVDRLIDSYLHARHARERYPDLPAWDEKGWTLSALQQNAACEAAARHAIFGRYSSKRKRQPRKRKGVAA